MRFRRSALTAVSLLGLLALGRPATAADVQVLFSSDSTTTAVNLKPLEPLSPALRALLAFYAMRANGGCPPGKTVGDKVAMQCPFTTALGTRRPVLGRADRPGQEVLQGRHPRPQPHPAAGGRDQPRRRPAAGLQRHPYTGHPSERLAGDPPPDDERGARADHRPRLLDRRPRRPAAAPSATSPSSVSTPTTWKS